MSKYKKIDLSKVKTYSIAKRKSKVEINQFAKVFDPKKSSFVEYLASLPRFLAVNELIEFSKLIVKARNKNKPVIFMIGAHVIKVGLSPLIIDLMKNDLVTAVAMNSAGAIHDSELALFGKTSEEVAEGITDGSFGMAKETGEFINNTLSRYEHSNLGYAEALAIEMKLNKV